MPTVTDPSGRVTADVDPAGEFAVDLDGEPVLEPSPFSIPSYGSFPDDYALQDLECRELDETYRLRHGKRSTVRHRATDAVFTYESRGSTVEFQVRVAPDGVAYRYRYPEDDDAVGFLEEGAAFTVPAGSVGYLHPYVYHHESSGRTVPVRELDGDSEWQFPALFQVGTDRWMLCCEAGVDGNWAAGRLTYRDGQFALTHPRTITRARTPFAAPWRVLIVGDLGTIVESTLTTDLVDGPRCDPTADWIEPGRVAWSWWSSGTGDLALGTRYVDYVADHGWEHVLIDAGWGREWMPDLVAYAAERDVGVFVWAHFTELNTESKRAARLARWSDWGVAGVKVDFMDADDQGRLQFYDAMAADCIEHELMVNFHGSIIPTGLRRRWPHVMTYEGVMGAEKHPGVTPEHNTILPFTRNVVGPMDYTPVTFSAEGFQTVGHELALAVVFESGLQHFADSIEEYAARPLAEAVLDSVPTVWDDTQLLRGKPGVETTLARRSGKDWFVGSISAGPATSIAVPFDFLDADREAELTRDDETGTALVREPITVSPTTVHSIPIPANGGFVVRL